jgi:hypothetical protein
MTGSSNTKKCPFCIEEIKAEAIKCKHCGEMLKKEEKQSASLNECEQKQICCPMCGSDQLTSQKKGFGWGKALVGGVLTGGIGLIAGFHGSRNIMITCLKCGHRFQPGPRKTKILKSIATCECGKFVFTATSDDKQPDLRCKNCGNIYAYPAWDAEITTGKKGTCILRLTPLGDTPLELKRIR